MVGTGASILVTGGAGYIGSHTEKALAERGAKPVVFDNLTSGHREALQWGPFVEGDIRDADALQAAFEQHSVSAVVHFAGLIEVARSVVSPDLFYDVNVNGTRVLLDAMRRAGVPKLVFSSSAAVYGASPHSASRPLIAEDDLKEPSSPYGETKLVGERMISAFCAAFGMTAVALRYFNAAGADPTGCIGEAHQPETHLIPLAIDSALGVRPPLTVNGVDYPTADGSCLRDYVHVGDLAQAHIAALEHEQLGGHFDAFNVGTGVGHSVLEVIAAVSRAAGRQVPYTVGPRRSGDPPSLVADPARATDILDWRWRYSLEDIVTSAVRWRTAPAFG
jgi:UDP-glucose 4-epimerase/UDP-arabinose 4-epimerase